MKSPKLPQYVVILIGVLTSLSAFATTVLPLTLEDLVERSDVVAHVRVGDVLIVETPEAPFRVTELVVIEPFLNSREGQVFELWQRGDGVNIFVVGDPLLERGQQGVAFLRDRGDRAFLTALSQSFWWIDRRGSGLTAHRDLSNINIVTRNETPLMPPNHVTWTVFRTMILEACREVGR